MRIGVALHRILLVAGIVGFFAFVLNATIPFAGRVVLEYTAGTPNGRITRLHPLDRVLSVPILDDTSIAESLIEDPVYFEIKTVVPYREVEVELAYRNRAGIIVSVGVRRGKAFESFDLVPIQELPSRGIWQRATARIDLTGALREKNRYRMIIALPGIAYDHPGSGDVLLSKMRITLRRDPLSISDIRSLLDFFVPKL